MEDDGYWPINHYRKDTFAIERRWKLARPAYWSDDMGKCSVTLYTVGQWEPRPGVSLTRSDAEHRVALYSHVAPGAEYRIVEQ